MNVYYGLTLGEPYHRVFLQMGSMQGNSIKTAGKEHCWKMIHARRFRIICFPGFNFGLCPRKKKVTKVCLKKKKNHKCSCRPAGVMTCSTASEGTIFNC